MKLLDNLNSQIDHILNSSLTFLTFIIIKIKFGLDLSGYFGLVLSISALVETIQGGLYERPAYLKQPIGYKNFKLTTPIIIFLCSLCNLIVYVNIYSESLFAAIIFCISTVLIRNIKTYDYITDDVKAASKRSFYIFSLSISYFILLYADLLNHNFTTFFTIISLIKLLFVLKNKNKIFKIKNTPDGKKTSDLKILLASLLILIKSRLPLWVLLPFGLGLIGIYETFRTLIEIFLLPSRGILNVMIKEISDKSIRKVMKTGFISGLVSSLALFVTYNFITSIEIYNHPEIRNIESLLSGTVLVLFFWMSETNSMILQYKKLHNLEIFRRLFAILVFVFLNIIFREIIDYKIFIILISSMYFLENIPVYFSKKSK
jgi:hypothetical protein